MTCSNESFNTASGMDCMQWQRIIRGKPFTLFQYRKRYGLHAIRRAFPCFAGGSVSIPQAVWIACNEMQREAKLENVLFQYRKRYGLHAINDSGRRRDSYHGFNTASGMDCMQYRPSQPLGQLNPEAGFLNGSLFLANRRNLAGFFCRQNRLKTSANPVISRKLLSTGKI